MLVEPSSGDFFEPRPAAFRQFDMAVRRLPHQIVGDRILPGAVERTGAAPGLPDLGIAARPRRHPLQELQDQKLRLARYRRLSVFSSLSSVSQFGSVAYTEKWYRGPGESRDLTVRRCSGKKWVPGFGGTAVRYLAQPGGYAGQGGDIDAVARRLADQRERVGALA